MSIRNLNRLCCLGLVLIANFSCQAPRQEKPPAENAFETGLRPLILFEDEPDPGWTLQERMDHYKVPGVGLAIIRNGRVWLAKGYGVKEAGTQDKVDADTVFSVGSVSKVVAAALTLKLTETEKLDLDRDVNEYLTSWQVPQSNFPSQAAVTLRMLMSHTAGFNLHGFGDFLPDEPLPTAVQTLNGESPAKHEPLAFLFPPGERFKYSGGGVTVEQLVISDVMQLPFEEVAAAHLFAPLGLTRSTFANPLPAAHGDIAKAHNREGQLAATPRGWEAMPEMAASGLWTSANELGQLVVMLIQSYQQEGQFLPRDLVVDMMTEVSPSWHGLGPRLDGVGRTRIFHHAGANNSYRAWMEGHLETGDGLVILTNGSNGTALMMELRHAVADALGWETHTPIRIKRLTLPAQAIAGFTGRFQPDESYPVSLRRYMVGGWFDAAMLISSSNGQLAMNVEGRNTTYPLIPLTPNRFLVANYHRGEVRLEIEFHRDIHARTQAFTLHLNNLSSHYRRVKEGGP